VSTPLCQAPIAGEAVVRVLPDDHAIVVAECYLGAMAGQGVPPVVGSRPATDPQVSYGDVPAPHILIAGKRIHSTVVFASTVISRARTEP
jgi:hypothetical protein